MDKNFKLECAHIEQRLILNNTKNTLLKDLSDTAALAVILAARRKISLIISSDLDIEIHQEGFDVQRIQTTFDTWAEVVTALEQYEVKNNG